ncbi:MAG: isoprenylcysteine carboxylmethyltransferase family protein [Clostridiales bacterium]|nr:isoprenylcysteine carboxylmethyltransferase family protein [Clostridiales bacterium]
MLFQILACAVLLIFYGIYFTKLLTQKRQGIRTHQIGTRKEKGLHTVELLMSVATLGIVVVQLLSIVLDWSLLPANARFTGFVTGLRGDLIFLVAVLTMKDSWRAGIPEKDKTQFVSSGIYAFSRNPAFLGFDFMYIGVGLLFCNPLSIGFTAFAVITLHLQILQEEAYLTQTFGEIYLNYKKRVFRYLGMSKQK